MEGRETERLKGTSSDHEFLLMARENVFERMTALLDFLKAQPSKASKKKLQARFSALEELKSIYNNNESEILRHNSKVSDPKARIPYKTQRSAVDEIIAEIIDEYETRMEQANQLGESKLTTHMHLPSIIIPSFSGKFREWHNFKDLFVSVIHDSTLPNVEKFQRLKSYLQGDALKLIDHIELTGSNYQIAFETLLNRYDNPRLAANSYLNALLNYRPVHNDSPASLQNYLNQHLDNVKAFRALSIADHFDYVLFQICYNHLDPKSQRDFDARYSVDIFPSYEDLMNFVQTRLRTFEMHSTDGEQRLKSAKDNVRHSFSVIARGNVSGQSASDVCIMCSQIHPLYVCTKFNGLPINSKYDFVRKNNLCFNCLKKHQRKLCMSTRKCKKCGQQHHTLLHIDNKPLANAKPQSANEVSTITMTCQDSNNITNFKSILLGTVRGYLRHAIRDCYVPTKILLDSGSQVSCISEELVTRLGIKVNPKITHLKGISGMSTKSTGTVQCRIHVFPNSTEGLSADLLVLPIVSANLPKLDILPSVNDRLRQLKLADPNFDQSGPVDILIGADHYYDIITDNHILKGEPNGIHTIFGVVLSGNIPTYTKSENNHSSLLTQDPLGSLLSKFWEVEEIKNVNLPESDFCERLFKKTTTRNATGRYVVALPFLPENPDSVLGENRSNALQRLLGIERRFSKNPALKRDYFAFMNEYLSLCHMSPAETSSKYVIPHHAVVKESATTKLRVVFDASNISNSNISLKQLLRKGPKLQRDIFLVLSGFREYKIALAADIEKMYRQILIRPEDRKWQHIFWRNEGDAQPQEFELHTVTYGLTSSAYLAQRVICQLVKDEGDAFPLAAKALSDQIYVDDIVCGGDTVGEALNLYSELTALLGKGGFFPRKWSSSSPEVLAGIPAEHKETPLKLKPEGEAIHKVLGLNWDPRIDAFIYKIEAFQGPPTKRTILSYIARMYDPLGWLSPFIFYCKYLMQLLWLEGTDWDDSMPEKLKPLWRNLMLNLERLGKIRIPRWISIKEAIEVTVVGFCDASERGYAAVLFLRCLFNKSVKVNMLAGKSKVAPIKSLSIPRLELNAALLLAKLLEAFKPFLDRLPKHSTLLFSDSQIALAWLRTPPHKLQTYIRNRVVEILSKTPPTVWHHVKSEENPSDCASRGLTPKELFKHSLWWNGPQFLYEKTLSPSKGLPPETLPELKRETHVVMVNIEHKDQPPRDSLLYSLEKFSSLSKLIRVFAYNLRFIHRTRHTVAPSGPLKVSELRVALEKYVQLNQGFYFKGEIKMLKAQTLPPSLKILSPFLDEKGLLRVGGRLKNAPLPYNTRHPLLIPPRSPLARSIVDQHHKLTLHGGPQTMRSSIQNTYWIPKIGHIIKSVLFGCQTCRRFKVKPSPPLMADLPPTRFDQVRPFLRSGVDFAGPFAVKETLRRKSHVFKCYISLFICFSTRAVHLEVVNSLTSDALLAAIDRFIARRGVCAYLHSDNGTNFVGAARKLAEVQTFLAAHSERLEEALSTRQIEWIFNPPAAPHFGGLWEAAVKSFKSHFQKIIGAHTFTLEEFSTLVCRIEAILNSRPLCPFNNPADAALCLTPGHFLIGSALTTAPELPLRDVALNRLSRWQLISQNVQHFWRIWSHSYLQTLMPRKKWNTPPAPYQEGDVVLVRDLKSSPLMWPLARIVEVIPGADNVGRVARIVCNGRTLTRPVHNLCKIFV